MALTHEYSQTDRAQADRQPKPRGLSYTGKLGGEQKGHESVQGSQIDNISSGYLPDLQGYFS